MITRHTSHASLKQPGSRKATAASHASLNNHTYHFKKKKGPRSLEWAPYLQNGYSFHQCFWRSSAIGPLQLSVPFLPTFSFLAFVQFKPGSFQFLALRGPVLNPVPTLAVVNKGYILFDQTPLIYGVTLKVRYPSPLRCQVPTLGHGSLNNFLRFLCGQVLLELSCFGQPLQIFCSLWIRPIFSFSQNEAYICFTPLCL